MSGQMKKTKTTTNKNPSNLHHKSRDPGDLRGRWRGLLWGKGLVGSCGGAAPWEAGGTQLLDLGGGLLKVNL